ncbi:unnamed protein product, partial [marine sediment metagenome]
MRADAVRLNPRKVLVLQTAFIGDLMMTTPLLEALHRGLPEAEVHLLVSPPAAELMEGDPRVNRVIVYDKRNKESGLGSFISLVSRIRRSDYDL